MSPKLEFICDFTVDLGPTQEMGECGPVTRRIIPIVGGTVSGELLQGRILAIGADWQTVEADGLALLDARYGVETTDGAVIEVISQGMRHMSPEIAARVARGEEVPFSDYYMRTAIRLATGHPNYRWVNRSLFLGAGGKIGQTVRLSIYRVG